MDHRIRIRLVPSFDATFRTAFERACVEAALACPDLDSPDAAGITRERLRASGYPEARIWIFGTVDEYRNRVSNWLVWRDGWGLATTVVPAAIAGRTSEAPRT